jgi:transposase
MKGRRREQQQQPQAGSQTPRHRRRFTHEFKLEAVRLAAAGDRRASAVARELGIRPEMLRRWARQAEARAGERPADIFPGNGKLMSQDEEIRRLRRENAVLREERDILGKATAFFAKGVR